MSVYPTDGATDAWFPMLPIPDRPHTRAAGIVGRCAPMGMQADFIRAPHRNILFSGGSGSGKTAIAAYVFLLCCLRVSDGQGLVVAKDRNMLRAVDWRAVMDLLDWWAKVNSFSFIKAKSFNELRITLINGCEITFKPADEADKFVGISADIIWGDEAAVWVDQINLFQKFQARLRGSRRAGVNQKLIFSTTPCGHTGIVGLFAQKCTVEVRPDIFVSNTARDHVGSDGWCLIYGDTAHNEIFEPGYIRAFTETMSKDLVEQEQRGRIVVVEGSVYAEYFSTRESIVPFRYDPTIHEIHVCIDWGQNKPYVGIVAHDPRARAGAADRPTDVIIDEYTKDRRGLHKALFRWIKERMAVHKIPYVRAFYPDPAGIKEVASLRLEFPGVPVHLFAKKADRDTRYGVDMVCSRLQTLDGRRHLFVSEELSRTEANTDPRGRGCVRMFMGLRWEEKRGSESTYRDVVKEDEHLINCGDALRYYITHQYREIGRAAYMV